MRLSTVVDYENHRLRDGWEKHDDCVYEWSLEFFVGADWFIFFQNIPQTYIVKCIVVYRQKYDYLPKKW